MKRVIVLMVLFLSLLFLYSCEDSDSDISVLDGYWRVYEAYNDGSVETKSSDDTWVDHFNSGDYIYYTVSGSSVTYCSSNAASYTISDNTINFTSASGSTYTGTYELDGTTLTIIYSSSHRDKYEKVDSSVVEGAYLSCSK
jgi:hypothetical protein